MNEVKNDGERVEQRRVDATYQCDSRGEHRYQSGLTAAEIDARQARDDLKERIATPRPKQRAR